MSVAIRIIASVTWLGLVFLVFMLWRIARFYERSAGKRAYSQFFLPPLLLLPLGTGYYIVQNVQFVGSPPADILLALGGSTLMVATLMLGQVMVGER